MVGHALQFLGGGFRRADVEAAIDLNAVGADELTIEALGERHRGAGFAASGATRDDQHLRPEGAHGTPRSVRRSTWWIADWRRIVSS